jgi:hypothetical protein
LAEGEEKETALLDIAAEPQYQRLKRVRQEAASMVAVEGIEHK